MTARILVTGGTGTLGRLVTSSLIESGCDIRVLSRRLRDVGDSGVESVVADLETGTGVDAAVAGVDVVVHCAGSRKGDDVKALSLTRSAAAAGVRHLVFISVVGADRVPIVSAVDRALFGYFAMKRAAERVIEDSGIPFTTLRATQFHELSFATLASMARMPVVPVPSGIRFQPIAAAEVAVRLVELALSAPGGLVPDMAGARAYGLNELLQGYLRATNRRRLLVPVRMPGGAAQALRDGANLALDQAVGQQTWEAFLAERTHRRARTPI